MVRIFFILSICCLLFSCRQIDLYEFNRDIKKGEWSRQDTIRGSFTISDTTAYYNIYIVLRHTDAYKYNNIWLNVGLAQGSDTLNFQRLNLTLGDDANGWEGSGMNDIWEVRKILNVQPRRFIRAGTYRFNINHIMRDSPLKNVLSAGLRIEKSPHF